MRPSRVSLSYGFHESGHRVVAETLGADLENAGHAVRLVPLLRHNEGGVAALGEVYRAFAAAGWAPLPEVLGARELLQALASDLADGTRRLLAGCDVAVATHPYTAFLLASAANSMAWPGRLVEVHTNFTPYPVFPHPRVDAVFGPPLPLAAPRAPIARATGIPVRRAFTSAAAEPARAGLLLIGGADGFGPLYEARAALRGLKLPLTVACGRNRDLAKQLQGSAEQGERVLVGVEDLSKHIAGAALVITKASGVTLAEAFASGTAVVCTPPVLPWEAEAGAWLSAAGAVLQVPDWSREALLEVQSILDDEARRGRQIRRAAALAPPDALDVVGAHLLHDDGPFVARHAPPSALRKQVATLVARSSQGPHSGTGAVLAAGLKRWHSTWSA